MSLNYFTDDFIQKWLTKKDLEEFQSINDKKLKAGMNWMSHIMESSFKRYDKMWSQMKDSCLNCMELNCKEDYDWILNNCELIKEEDEFKKIKFKSKESGKIGMGKIKSYHACKKKCYEKVNLMNATFSRKFNQFSKEFELCFVLCRGHPIVGENYLSDCYSDCFVKASKKLPEIEFSITKLYKQIIDEYNENKLDFPGVDLINNYRFKEREFTEDLWKKYL